MRAWLNLRYTDDKRAELFSKGLQRLGYEVLQGSTISPRDGDIYLTWNRVGEADRFARVFESRGLPVLVAENATWGNLFAGEKWFHVARNYHNTADRFDVIDFDRWDALQITLAQWRAVGETVILPQRGIGSPPVCMPHTFTRKAIAAHGGRVREHPGKRKVKPLEQDLKHCGKVVTWGSGAAIKALMMGIPCVSYMPNWIGEQDNTDFGRLEMFRRLAWAQWRYSDIKSGLAFEYLLQ